MFTGFWQCFAVIKDSDISLTRFTQLSYGNHFLYGSFFLESFPAWPFLSAGRIQAAGFSACGEFPWTTSGFPARRILAVISCPVFHFQTNLSISFCIPEKILHIFCLIVLKTQIISSFFINYGFTLYRDMIFLWIIYQNSSLFSLIIYHIRYWRLESVKL